MTRFGYPASHGLAVDAYAASHGGDGSQRRDRQSVCVHLIALCVVLDRGNAPAKRTALLRRLTARKRDWPRLTRPSGIPALDHTHAENASNLENYASRVEEWAHAVWLFWTPEHRRIKDLLDQGGPL